MTSTRANRVLRGWPRSLTFAGSWLVSIFVIPPSIDALGPPWSHLAWPSLVVILVLVVRAVRSAVVISDLRVTVRKVWWTSSVLRTDVTDVVVMDSAMLKFDSCLGIARANAKPLKVPYLSPGICDEDNLPLFQRDVLLKPEA